MSKFKVGDLVEVLKDNASGSGYKIGHVGHVKEICEDSCRVGPRNFGNWVNFRLIKKGIEQMEKSDLRTGMLLALRDGKIVRVLLDTENGDIVSGANAWFSLDELNETLEKCGFGHNDVMAVYVPIYNCDYSKLNIDPNSAKRVWARLDKVKVTTEIDGKKKVVNISKESAKELGLI